MIFFTSDLHFGHGNIIRYDNRPFADADEMDEFLIRNWNVKVKPHDTVCILGDVSWHNAAKTKDILSSLNGRKILVHGNHDQVCFQIKDCFDSIVSYMEIKSGIRKIILCHYPIPFYNAQHSGNAVMLYGHVHNSREWIMTKAFQSAIRARDIPCDMFNVGCMLWNYEPVTLEEILQHEERNEVHATAQ